ncbi:multicopper oxidase-domain-containing protein [Emericellopsis atlantica]|uniref:Multicopper oxidase-domain-containing protein n=1 Tax=Emericellopsis atlantica TaxID=2614577 RepID=A0A9P8CNL3_9HYPO|nr:multicopper oxidase-domain-containing protein [Emericellopsis atlantica]KAG9253633.1 multicopper oxidase-domain-containing protein [Emericellopsis atlantica]
MRHGLLRLLAAGAALFMGEASAKLDQMKTNGHSVLGTLDAPTLPKYLSGAPMPNGAPWSNMTAKTNYYHDKPNTGVIRRYEFTVSRGVIAPDGYQRDVLLINDQFPGPLIEANWGDTIQVQVLNNITGPEEGTALHWHGLLHRDMPWEDGVPSVTQCPIAPGESYTYNFIADMHGSTWYHSHYSAQYADGLFGPMVIYGPEQEEYDIDLGPVMLSDWYHRQYHEIVSQLLLVNLTQGGVYTQNNLINGKMNYDCRIPEIVNKLNSTALTKLANKLNASAPCDSDAGVSQFRFEKGKKHRLRLVNSGGEGMQRFSIDEHSMTVISNDFIQVEPYETQVVTLGVGQRADVIVEANGDKDGAYWMRSNVSVLCNAALQPSAMAAIYYDDADTESLPSSVAWNRPDPATCGNDALEVTRPVMEMPVPEPDLTINMTMTMFMNESNILQFATNDNVGFRGNYNSPTMLLSNLGNHSFAPEWNVQSTKNAKSVRVILYNEIPEPHPMHLHGFNMYILAEGGVNATWDGTIVHPENPQRRDTFLIQPLGYTVFQFDAGTNPGVWPFHCHVALHVSAGMMTQFMTMPDEIEEYKVPNKVAETCRQWGKWTHTNIPNQIDSGL